MKAAATLTFLSPHHQNQARSMSEGGSVKSLSGFAKSSARSSNNHNQMKRVKPRPVFTTERKNTSHIIPSFARFPYSRQNFIAKNPTQPDSHSPTHLHPYRHGHSPTPFLLHHLPRTSKEKPTFIPVTSTKTRPRKRRRR